MIEAGLPLSKNRFHTIEAVARHRINKIPVLFTVPLRVIRSAAGAVAKVASGANALPRNAGLPERPRTASALRFCIPKLLN